MLWHRKTGDHARLNQDDVAASLPIPPPARALERADGVGHEENNAIQLLFDFAPLHH